MFDEIGSEYWKADLKREPNARIPYAVYTASGRSAQSLIIESANITNKVALLPAYTCQHIVEPFAWKGWKVEFYDINHDLTPNLNSFKDKLQDNPGCIIVEGYYSFPTAESIVQLLETAQNNGIVVVEDITHSFLNDTQLIYSKADYLFCSLRKWSGLSDGGYAVSLHGNKLLNPEHSMTAFADERHVAREIKLEYTKTLDPKTKEKFLYHYGHSEELLDGDIGIYCMSDQAMDDYLHLDFDFIKEQRRANYQYLSDNMHSSYVKAIFPRLFDGIYPIMFPVYIEGCRDELRTLLINNRIYCPVHWPAPVQLDEAARRGSEYIYGNIMSIPCDQRYTETDMKRLVDMINAFKPEGEKL